MVKSIVDTWEEPSTVPDTGVWEVRYNEKSRMGIVPWSVFEAGLTFPFSHPCEAAIETEYILTSLRTSPDQKGRVEKSVPQEPM